MFIRFYNQNNPNAPIFTMLQKKLFFFLLLISGITQGQTYIKANAVTTLALIPNFGIETPIAEKFTFQADVTASFWKSIKNGPFQFVLVIPEVRYHFNSNTNGFYVGGHIGGGTFKLQKWDYTNTLYYQKGINYVVGGTIGYQKEISKKLALDIFIGGGSQQAFYHGYYLDTNERYEGAQKYNKSGEWLPYRGGIMLCYKLD